MTIRQDLSVVFPGQGSQKIGMLGDFSEYDIVTSTFKEASEVLSYDLWDLIQNGEQEKLNMTEITQPALLTSSIALWRLWQDKTSALPAYVAGHSLGEWSALVAANVVKLGDAVKLVQLRGRFMQEAVPQGEGAMAAIIGLDDQVVVNICSDSQIEGEVCSAVNFNSPGQLVIAGSKASVEKAIENCKAAGAKRALALPVSAPFHTSLMKPASEKLSSFIRDCEFRSSSVPVVHNVTANNENDPEKIKALMIEQIYSPVRWVECVQYLRKKDISKSVEMGPGKVLSGLNKRIDKSIESLPTETLDSFNSSLVNVEG